MLSSYASRVPPFSLTSVVKWPHPYHHLDIPTASAPGRRHVDGLGGVLPVRHRRLEDTQDNVPQLGVAENVCRVLTTAVYVAAGLAIHQLEAVLVCLLVRVPLGMWSRQRPRFSS
jgi:hypothetical protein